MSTASIPTKSPARYWRPFPSGNSCECLADPAACRATSGRFSGGVCSGGRHPLGHLLARLVRAADQSLGAAPRGSISAQLVRPPANYWLVAPAPRSVVARDAVLAAPSADRIRARPGAGRPLLLGSGTGWSDSAQAITAWVGSDVALPVSGSRAPHWADDRGDVHRLRRKDNPRRDHASRHAPGTLAGGGFAHIS